MDSSSHVSLGVDFRTSTSVAKMPREDSHRTDHSEGSSRIRFPSPPKRYSGRSDHASTRDGKISYREKGDGEGRRSRGDRHERTKDDRRERIRDDRPERIEDDRTERKKDDRRELTEDDRRQRTKDVRKERESSRKETRQDRPHRHGSRSRSKSPPSGRSQPPSQIQSNLDKYKTSGLLNAMNPVGGESLSKNEKLEEKLKPNFGLSGKLAEDTNKFNGVVVKYNEPPEAKKPSRKWRLYPFKGEESLEHIEINKQSAFLLGRDRRVADIPIDHPSCSSQHAVIQFRAIRFEREDGTSGKKVRPYLVDLESSNGTFLNNKQIEPRKYYEIFEKDCIKFGFSSREYVLMHAEYQEDDK